MYSSLLLNVQEITDQIPGVSYHVLNADRSADETVPIGNFANWTQSIASKVFVMYLTANIYLK